GGGVSVPDAVGEGLPVLARELDEHRRADRAREVAAHRRLQVVDRHGPAGAGGDTLERQIRPFPGELVILRVADEDVGEWPDLHRAPLEAWRLHPRVLPVVLELGVLRDRLADPRLLDPPDVTGVRQILGHPVAPPTIARGRDAMDGPPVGAENSHAEETV